jgi:hypothetical protein
MNALHALQPANQPDLLMPREMIVPGVELPDALARLESSGARVTSMETISHCNGTWRLELFWPCSPQIERKP